MLYRGRVCILTVAFGLGVLACDDSDPGQDQELETVQEPSRPPGSSRGRVQKPIARPSPPLDAGAPDDAALEAGGGD